MATDADKFQQSIKQAKEFGEKVRERVGSSDSLQDVRDAIQTINEEEKFSTYARPSQTPIGFLPQQGIMANLLPTTYQQLAVSAIPMGKPVLGIADYLAGGSGDYTALQGYAKNVLGMGQEDANMFALKGINIPEEFEAITADPAYQTYADESLQELYALRDQPQGRDEIIPTAFAPSPPVVTPGLPSTSRTLGLDTLANIVDPFGVVLRSGLGSFLN